jgi:DNA-binding FrmR family transcriptional regulator
MKTLSDIPTVYESEVVVRLKRTEGRLRSTIAMIEAGCSCVDLAQQLHAIEKAVCNAKRELIHDHIDHCLELQANSDTSCAKEAIKDFKEISKYL